MYINIHVLLDAEYSEPAEAYVAVDPPNDDPRPQMYLHNVGKGKVLYLLLGHCRGKYDMRPFMDEVTVDSGVGGNNWGGPAIDPGRNIMVAPRWSWLASKIVSYNNKETYSWKKTSSPCRYSSTTKGIEFYNNDFLVVSRGCQIKALKAMTLLIKMAHY